MFTTLTYLFYSTCLVLSFLIRRRIEFKKSCCHSKDVRLLKIHDTIANIKITRQLTDF